MQGALSGLRVLYVHQNYADPSGIIGMLETAGSAVRSETSGWLALELFRSEPPDVLISEIDISDQADLNLIQRIRASKPRRQWNVPAIALSCHAQPEDHRNAIQAGFSAYLARPADPEAFVKSITYALHQAAEATA